MNLKLSPPNSNISCKIENVNLSNFQKKWRENLWNQGLGKEFIDLIPKEGSIKGNTEKLDLIRMKKLLLCKRLHDEDENINYRLGENICKLYIW